MGSRFLSRNNNKDNDDDDLVRRQLSALEGSTESTGLNDGGTGEDDTADTVCDGKPYEAAQTASMAEKKSVIQQDMVITGSVTAVMPLLIFGTVNGNVVCENEVTIDGNIEGDVKGGNLQVLSGQIRGDVESKNDVTVIKGAVINGNISGGSLRCDGKIEGNTNVKGKAAINENAVIIGDIVCEKISIREGAVCKGNIQTDVTKTGSAAGTDAAVKADNVNKDKTSVGIVTNLKNYI